MAPLDRARQTFETNYFGAVRMIQAVLPGMRARRGGTIVNVTSIAGRVALPAHSHYAASKFALDALSEGLAAEVRPFGIRVAIIEPGVIRTPMLARRPSNPAFAPYEIPVRRLSRFFRKQLEEPNPPEAVAEAIEHAVLTDAPRLRYLVGRDAAALSVGRARLSDEEWIAGHSMESDDAFFDFMERALGTDLYR
jgi:NAD(P)-dependent dehydrogenase (short-subunit alcohol dehydrogenase family)